MTTKDIRVRLVVDEWTLGDVPHEASPKAVSDPPPT
jgi:hypothetical protein